MTNEAAPTSSGKSAVPVRARATSSSSSDSASAESSSVHRLRGRRRARPIGCSPKAHELRRRGIDVVIGFVETHARVETDAQIGDLEIVPRQLDRISRCHARGDGRRRHHRAPSRRRHRRRARAHECARRQASKRWEDVLELLDAGINVISAVNVQHLESLNDVLAARRSASRCAKPSPTGSSARPTRSSTSIISAEDLRQRLRRRKDLSHRRRSPPRWRISSPRKISRRCASSRSAKWRAPSIARASTSSSAKRKAPRRQAPLIAPSIAFSSPCRATRRARRRCCAKAAESPAV